MTRAELESELITLARLSFRRALSRYVSAEQFLGAQHRTLGRKQVELAIGLGWHLPHPKPDEVENPEVVLAPGASD